MKLTRENLHFGDLDRCGWNKSMLKLVGVDWPPKKGWLSKLVGTEISEETYAAILKLRRHRP